jgi:hypothetical protein
MGDEPVYPAYPGTGVSPQPTNLQDKSLAELLKDLSQQWRRQPLAIIIASATLVAVLAASSLRRRRVHR